MIPNTTTQIWAMAQAARILPRLPAPIRRWVTSFAGGPAAMLEGARLRDPGTLR